MGREDGEGGRWEERGTGWWEMGWWENKVGVGKSEGNQIIAVLCVEWNSKNWHVHIHREHRMKQRRICLASEKTGRLFAKYSMWNETVSIHRACRVKLCASDECWQTSFEFYYHGQSEAKIAHVFSE